MRQKVGHGISWMRAGLLAGLVAGVALVLALGIVTRTPVAGAASGAAPQSGRLTAPLIMAGALTTPTATSTTQATERTDTPPSTSAAGSAPFLGLSDSTWLMIGAGLWSLAAGLLVATFVALGKRRRLKRDARHHAEEAQMAQEALSRIRSWH